MKRDGDRRVDIWGHGAAALSLLGVLILSAAGCAPQETIQADAVNVADAPVVTVRTLTSRTRYRHGGAQLVAQVAPAEEVKPRRRRRRPRPPKPETPPQPSTASPQPASAEPTPSIEKPIAADASPAVPEHVIEPKAPARETTPAPEPAPKAPPTDGKSDQ